ncbi:MAG: hypothetical protein II886_13135 [Prevotella sp.]|nr:hypothetical protein [Prevotella sp.]
MERIESFVFDLPNDRLSDTVTSGSLYSSPEKLTEIEVKAKDGKTYTIIGWGNDNQLPYEIKDKVERNSVMMQNKFFNLLTCYGRGLEYMDVATLGDKEPKPTRDKDIRRWLLRSSVKRFFAEQIVDLKYYFFAVAVVILDRQRQTIVKIVHKDACHCRFQKADDRTGRIGHVLFADWKDDNAPDNVEAIPLLDEQDPLGDLMARTGRERDLYNNFTPDRASCCMYAVVCKIPTPGCQYYPIPTYSAVFRDGWYDIYGLLTAAKKAKIKNGQNIRYHVEINLEFWESRARSRGISIGSTAFEDMKTEFIDQLKMYLGGSQNSDKVVWSEFESLIDGKEKHYLKINVVDTSKAGSEYNDDVAEAANVLCYDDNVHPNLAGATPGKSQMNNSGSDKRELFTMKQSLETLPHDMLLTVHHLAICFNGWEDRVEPVIPMIILTTLDKNTDAKQVNMNNNANSDDNGNNQGNQ